MKRGSTAFLTFLVLMLQYTLPAATQVTNATRYTLLTGSDFEDVCLLRGRLTILEPLRGTFDLFVVTDTQAPRPPPRIVRQTIAVGLLHFECAGPGSVFQLENASSPVGPWLPLSGIIPDLSWDTRVDPSGGASGFFLLRQW